MLTGFSTWDAYEAGTPVWEPAIVYRSLDVATAVARCWIRATGRQATVDVVEVDEAYAPGRRLRVLTAAGQRDIER
jgi:hypothetical protein